jgi:tetratricopeptide (TPR) repeat protein
MSPEQARGAALDHRTDVWSLGVVLYEMLTGATPYGAASPTETLSAILRDPVPRLPFAEELQRIIDKCLAKDPNHRYQGMKDLAVDLRAVRLRLESGALESRDKKTSKRWRLAIALGVLLIGGLFFSRLWTRAPADLPASVALRRSVAVVGFKNLSGSPDQAWLSTALTEMFTSELAAGETLRTIPGENVARMRIELRLAETESFGAETLARIRANLGCDLVVLGSYLALGETGGGKIRLDLRLQDAQMGETVASISDAGKEEDLLDVVSRTGARLRERLGVAEPTPEAAASVAASLPSNPEAARLYSEALQRLQRFDALAARDLLERAAAIEPEHPLTQSMLARAWSLLGYDEKAKAAAQKAFERSGSLSREMRLLIEARLREARKEWDRAIDIHRTLYEFFPDNLDYGLHLAEAQISANKYREALATLEGLRKLPFSASVDPRIDIVEASAVASLGEDRRAQEISSAAAKKAMAHGAPLLAARARTHEGSLLVDLDRYDEAIAAANEAKEAFAAAGDRRGVADTLSVTQQVLLSRGDLIAAEKVGEERLATYREIGDTAGVAGAMFTNAAILQMRGELADAMTLYGEVLPIFREISDKDGERLVLNNTGELLQTQGDLGRAATSYEQFLAISREMGRKAGVAQALVNIAAVRESQGDLATAKKMYEEAVAMRRELEQPYGVGHGLMKLADLLLTSGDLAGARSTYEESLAIRERLGGKVDIAETQLGLATLNIEEGRPDSAEDLARQALKRFEAEKMIHRGAAACEILARSLLAQGKTAEARRTIERAGELTSQSPDFYVHLAIEITKARVLASVGSSAEAVKGLMAAHAEAEQRGFAGFQLQIRLALGEIEIRSGNGEAGRLRLQSVEKDALERGFGLVARKARELMTRPREPDR